jgi:cysteine-rich repeat protein
MLARPHKPRRAPLLAAALLAACHFESAGLGDEGAGPNADDPAPASAQTSEDPTASSSPGSSSSVTAGVTGDADSDSTSEGVSGSDSNADSTGDSTGVMPPPPGCGNGVVDPGEQCDGGNDPPCTPVCTLNVCGDGYLGPTEQCDDAGANGDDKACTSTCQNARCGDGLLGPGEACDDGNAFNTDACLSGCIPAACGDGFQQMNVESCDLGAGNGAYGGACNVTCNGPGPNCGDGVWDPQHEACDGDGAPPGADCQDGCKPECEFGKVDCNNNLADGCQGLLTDKNNCGSCGKKCPNACVLGVCY